MSAFCGTRSKSIASFLFKEVIQEYDERVHYFCTKSHIDGRKNAFNELSDTNNVS
jgi:hypothetical protein